VAAAVAGAAVTLGVMSVIDRTARSERVYAATLHGLSTDGSARASARLASLPAGTSVELSVSGLQPSPGAVYELWCIRDDGSRMSAGTFRVDRSGEAYVHLTTAARLGEYHRLSVERAARHGPATRVMAGQVAY